MQTNLNITHYLAATFGKTGNCKLIASTNCNGYAPQKFNAGGYGYDKFGTVLGRYLMVNFAEEIKELTKDKPDGYTLGALFKRNGKVYIDGATGDEAVAETMQAIGLGIAKTSDKETYIVYRAEPQYLFKRITNLNYLFKSLQSL
jgi:hypothetical protein